MKKKCRECKKEIVSGGVKLWDGEGNFFVHKSCLNENYEVGSKVKN